jgi:hypothetical protein
MPEVRMLLALRAHENRMRKRLALCDELCGSLESVYRAARAIADSGLGAAQAEIDMCIRRAPASAHTICSMIRDFAEALNRVSDLLDFEAGAGESAPAVSVDSPVAPIVRSTLTAAVDEHRRLRSWDELTWIGLLCDDRRRLTFLWRDAMECVQKNPKRAYPAMRPLVLMARRVAEDAMKLLDPLTGPIAEERAAAYTIAKKLRSQIDHIRSLVNRKCDALEEEMQSVQSAIVKAQSQTMSLVKNLATLGGGADA